MNGCGDVCTEAFCPDMLTLRIHSASGDFEDGDYSFTLSPSGIGDVTAECTLAGGVLTANCSAWKGDFSVEIEFTGISFKAELTASPSSLEGAGSVNLRIMLDDELLGEQLLTPNYGEGFYCNGKECDEFLSFQTEESITL